MEIKRLNETQFQATDEDGNTVIFDADNDDHAVDVLHEILNKQTGDV